MTPGSHLRCATDREGHSFCDPSFLTQEVILSPCEGSPDAEPSRPAEETTVPSPSPSSTAGCPGLRPTSWTHASPTASDPSAHVQRHVLKVRPSIPVWTIHPSSVGHGLSLKEHFTRSLHPPALVLEVIQQPRQRRKTPFSAYWELRQCLLGETKRGSDKPTHLPLTELLQ